MAEISEKLRVIYVFLRVFVLFFVQFCMHAVHARPLWMPGSAIQTAQGQLQIAYVWLNMDVACEAFCNWLGRARVASP